MTTLEREAALLAHAAEEFKDTAWEGCAELDCIEGCSLAPRRFRCERFERAFCVWLIENRPELVAP